MLRTYDDFVAAVEEIGFLTLSENPAGWPNLEALTDPGQWFTDGPNDPWQWRARIARERRAAYAKIFFGMPSFISPPWYPVFLSARRGGLTFEEVWEQGNASSEAKRIHDLFLARETLATHEIKRLGVFAGKGGRYERAMTALQTGMFLTVCGMTRMTTLDGRPYSWPVSEYMPVDKWAWEGMVEQAGRLDQKDAVGIIEEQIRKISPASPAKTIAGFTGRQSNTPNLLRG